MHKPRAQLLLAWISSDFNCNRIRLGRIYTQTHTRKASVLQKQFRTRAHHIRARLGKKSNSRFKKGSVLGFLPPPLWCGVQTFACRQLMAEYNLDFSTLACTNGHDTGKVKIQQKFNPHSSYFIYAVYTWKFISTTKNVAFISLSFFSV